MTTATPPSAKQLEETAQEVHTLTRQAIDYASQPADNTERVAAMLRQYAEGNFADAGPSSTPGLSQIWKRGWQ